MLGGKASTYTEPIHQVYGRQEQRSGSQTDFALG